MSITHAHKFSDGEVITIEPFRAKAFPVVRDLVVDRSAFDRITQAGGFITVRTGSAPDGNALPVPKDDSDKAMDAAACIGCGACVASCKNASAMLFTSAKAGHLNLLRKDKLRKISGFLPWSRRWMKPASVIVGTMANVPLHVPRIFP